MLNIKAYAKINLVLNIEGTANGMHLIDSIVTPFNIYDEVVMEKREDNEITVNYTGCSTVIQNDTALKMANIIQREFHTGGVSINISKNIPFKAGLGGSSADAGAVARGMEQLFTLTGIPTELLMEVGSDVPYMYCGGDKRIRGIGEIVTPVALPELYKVLITDDEGVDTKKSYESYDISGGENQDIDLFLEDINNKKAKFTNALQRGSELLNDKISYAYKLLTVCGFAASMTGSGSGVFGIAYGKEEFEIKLKKLIEKKTNLKFFVS